MAHSIHRPIPLSLENLVFSPGNFYLAATNQQKISNKLTSLDHQLLKYSLAPNCKVGGRGGVKLKILGKKNSQIDLIIIRE